MIRSLVARLTLLQQLTALLAIAAFAVLAVGITSQVMRAERRAFVASTASRLAEGFHQELVDEPDTVAAAQSMVEDGHDVGVQVRVRNAAGRVLASSLPGDGAVEADSTRGLPSGIERFVSTANGPSGIRVTAVGTDAAGRAALSALRRALWIAAVPILAAGLLLGRTVAARALRPLSAMAQRAAGLTAERNPRSLGERSGLAELDLLGDSFDRLLERLDDAMRAERRLTADASHELRTPLTVLGGELELLREATPAGTPAARAMERATAQVAAMRELVDAILILHRSREVGPTQAAGFEVVNLCDLAREALSEARTRYPGRNPDVTLDAPDEILVAGNAALLASAARNLLDNALKFTSAGERVAVAVAEAAGNALLAVDDAGRGIREDERERVFDPFFRGAAGRDGAAGFGLGLPILRRVARAHGGDVEVARSPLGGARFVMRVPSYQAVRGC